MHKILNDLRIKHNLTYQQLADMSDVPIGTVKSVLTGVTANPGFETVCALLKAMGESADALVSGEQPSCAAQPSRDIILEQTATVAAQAATLEARNENISRYQDRIAKLEAELSFARRRANRMQLCLVILIVAIIALAAVYIWDVRNLHSGLTAYFNK